MIKHNRALPIGVLVVALLVVLASIGVASGLWSKNLVVEGTVETGDLQVDWTFNTTGTGDDQCTLFNPLFPDCGVPKDVGKFICTVDQADNQILHFRALNAYPSYEADCQYHFANTGSIPWIVRGAEILGGANVTGCGGDIDPDPKTLVIDCDQITIGYFDNIGDQVDPGNEVSGSIKIHIKQEAEQSDCTAESTDIIGVGVIVSPITCDPATLVTYDFQIFVCVAQWNEAATYEECKSSPQHEGPAPGCGLAAVVDICVDGDGIATAGPGAFQIAVGDPVLPASAGGNPSGLDLIDRGGNDGLYQAGDDLMVEDPFGTPNCPTASRNAIYDNDPAGVLPPFFFPAVDCVVLDPDGSLAHGDVVTCDTGAGCGLWFRDDNGNGRYDVGEDLIVDVNGSGFFD